MKWIKVEDELPKKNQWVLAYGLLEERSEKECKDEDCINDLASGVKKRTIKVVQYDGDWSSSLWYFQDHCCETGLYHVTHWMPLPEKPKE